jgi:Flp pilus assembly protein TadD
LVSREQIDEAIAHYQKALEVKPDYAEAHSNLGAALVLEKRLDEAIAHCQKALEIKPDYADAHNNLGIALANRKQFDEAITHYQKALQINPDYANARSNLDIVQSQWGELRKTLAGRRESLRSRPNDIALLNETAWVLATNPNASIRNGTEAVELAQRAVQLSDRREPAVLGTLAAAYAEAGRFPEAVQTARKALELATEQNKQSLAESVKAKIPLYKAGTPFREMQQPAPSKSAQP